MIPLQRMLRYAAGIVLAFILLSWMGAVYFIFPYRRDPGEPPSHFPAPIDTVSFLTPDGIRIRGWYSAAANRAATVVLLHGYHATRRQTLSRARLLRAHGFGVLLYDARAHGESGGSRISVGYYEARDLLAALRFLRSEGVETIACLGISQGGATVLLAAGRLQEVRCVIIESAYSTIIDAVDRRFRHYSGIPGRFGAALLIPFCEMLLEVNAEAISPIDKIVNKTGENSERNVTFLLQQAFLLGNVKYLCIFIVDAALSRFPLAIPPGENGARAPGGKK